ncbi:MAG: penicillin-binding protein activator [Deltaproteobacteria bacterium]|nr:penicillin-binding protein activator [Candidatus Anaeroferrophillus wilburensis]MBN2889065.1 penicillin-binding protein activator [Deltaproteobacteria bacterium]
MPPPASAISAVRERVRVVAPPMVGDRDGQSAAKRSFLTGKEGGLPTGKLSLLRVGCLLPLSGDFSSYGRRFLKGMELALSVYGQATGGALVREIVLLVRDTGGLADAAIPLVHELAVKEHVSLLVGPVVGSVASAVARETLDLGIPLILLSSQPGLVNGEHGVFQHFLTSRNQAEQLARLMSSRAAVTVPSVFYPDTVFGRTFSQFFAAAAGRAGFAPSRLVSYQASATDFGIPIRRLLVDCLPVPVEEGEKPATECQLPEQFLVIPDNARRLRLLAPQLAHYGMTRVHIFGSRGWHELHDELKKESGVAGVQFVDAFYAGSDAPERLVCYRNRYQAMFAQPASLYDAYGFDTVCLLKEIGEAITGDTSDPQQVISAVRSLPPLEMVTGCTSLTADGEFEKQLYWLSISDDGTIQGVAGEQALMNQ